MNVKKVTEINIWIVNIELADIANNVPVSTVTTEENVNTKMDKKYACKFIDFYCLEYVFIFGYILGALVIITVISVNSMVKFLG